MPPRSTAAPGLFSAAPPASSIPAKAAWMTAHCDGGARGNPGPAGYGALLQDGQGNVVAELSEFLGIRSNNVAEYSGLLGCLQYALDHHHPRLRVISDSELMVKQIQGKYQVKSPDLKPLFDEARRRIARLDAFEITHALRHKNKDADRLANEAMDRGMKRGSAADPTASRAAVQDLAEAPRKAIPYPKAPQAPAAPASSADAMLRGFTKDGVVHILGNATLPNGIFVKIIRE